MDWRSVVLDNWPYKLAAAVLALLLWLNVTAEERQEFPVPTDLRVDMQDPNWVLVRLVPEQVRTVFQGLRGPVMPRMPVIRYVVDSVTGPRMELELSPDMVRGYDRELDLRPVGIRPQTVELRLERRVSAKVPVEPRLRLSAAPGFAVIRPVLLQPDSVTVGGAESEVASVSGVRTEEAVLEELRRTVTRELQIRPPEGLDHVDWDPGTVLATVEVDSLVERSVSRPLEIEGAAAGGVRASRDSVRVRLRGPRQDVGAVSPGGIRAYVLVGSVPEEPTRLTVRVELPDGLQLTADADPSEVTVEAVGAAGATGSDGRGTGAGQARPAGTGAGAAGGRGAG